MPHILDMLHNICFIFHIMLFISYFFLFCSTNMLFINHALKFKYQPGHVKVYHIYPNNKEPCMLDDCSL